MHNETTIWKLLVKAFILNHFEQIEGVGESRLFNLWSVHGIGGTFFLQAAKDYLASYSGIRLFDHIDAMQTDFENKAIIVEQSRHVYLIDGNEHLYNSETLYQFEQEVILPLLSYPGTILLITTPVSVIPWSTSTVWQKTENLQLQSLSRKQVSQLAEVNEVDPSLMWEATLGYPLALLEWLKDTSLSVLEIARLSFANVVEECSVEAQNLATIASLLPVFNVAALRAAEGSDSDDDVLYATYSDNIRELMAKGVVIWDSDKGWFRFSDGAVRRLFARKLRIEQPETFLRIHSRAYGYFEAEVAHSAYLQYSFVSAIYHLAYTLSDIEEVSVGEACRKWVLQHLSSWEGADWYAIYRSWLEGNGDKTVKDELQSILTHRSFNDISRLIGQELEDVK